MIHGLQQSVYLCPAEFSGTVCLPVFCQQIPDTLKAVPVLSEARYQSKALFIVLKALVAAFYQIMDILPANFETLRGLRKAQILKYAGFINLLLVLRKQRSVKIV